MLKPTEYLLAREPRDDIKSQGPTPSLQIMCMGLLTGKLVVDGESINEVASEETWSRKVFSLGEQICALLY